MKSITTLRTVRLVLTLLLAASVLTGCGQREMGGSAVPGESPDAFFCFTLDPGESPAPDADPRCPPGTG